MTDPPPTGQRRRRRGRPAADLGTQRARFVRVAVQVFTLYGAEASMAQIAKAAGVTKPVLYQYFRDKTDLSRAVGEHSANLLLARVRELLSERTGTLVGGSERVGASGGSAGGSERATASGGGSERAGASGGASGRTGTSGGGSERPGASGGSAGGFERATASAGGGEAIDRARAVVEVYLDVISGDHDLYQFALYSQLMTIPQAGFTSTFTRALAFLLADELCASASTPSASTPAAQARCHALAGMLHTVCHWWLYHRYPSREALSDGLSRILAAAITTPANHT